MDTVTGDLDLIVRAHRDVYTSLLELCEELDDHQWTAVTGCPGWTVRDCLAHVVGLEAVMAGDPEPAPIAVAPAHADGDLGHYMERHVAARRSMDVPDLLLEARDVFSRRLGQLDLLTSADDEVLQLRGRRGPAGRVLPIRAFDLWVHEQDIRRAVGVPGHLEGVAPRLSRDRLLAGLRRLLPDRVGRPGVTLVVSVTGPNAITWALDLSTGALASPSGSPRIRIVLPFAHFVARSCGRADAPEAELAVVEGDPDLAGRILDRFAVTP